MISGNIIEFTKHAMTVNVKNGRIEGNTFVQMQRPNQTSSSTTLMLIYSFEDLVVRSNTWIEHHDTVSRVLSLASAGGGEYRSGKLTVDSNVVTTQKGSPHFIIHEMNRNHPHNEKMRYEITNNTFNNNPTATPSYGGFLVFFPASNTNPAESLRTRVPDIIEVESVISGNKVTNLSRGWLYVDLFMEDHDPSKVEIVGGGFFKINNNDPTGRLSTMIRVGTNYHDVDGTSRAFLSREPTAPNSWSNFLATT